MDLHKIETVLLSKCHVMATQVAELRYVQDMHCDVLADHMAPRLLLSLRGWLAGKQHETHHTEVVARVPADWWQHFRQRWFPKWWLERHPVRLRDIIATTDIHKTWVCPHVATTFPPDQEHLRFMVKCSET